MQTREKTAGHKPPELGDRPGTASPSRPLREPGCHRELGLVAAELEVTSVCGLTALFGIIHQGGPRTLTQARAHPPDEDTEAQPAGGITAGTGRPGSPPGLPDSTSRCPVRGPAPMRSALARLGEGWEAPQSTPLTPSPGSTTGNAGAPPWAETGTTGPSLRQAPVRGTEPSV